MEEEEEQEDDDNNNDDDNNDDYHDDDNDTHTLVAELSRAGSRHLALMKTIPVNCSCTVWISSILMNTALSCTTRCTSMNIMNVTSL